MSKQLALFGGEPPKKDLRKQQVADQVGMMGFTADMDFAQQVRHVTLDGRTYYSVLDVLKHYGSEGSAKNPREYWKNIQSQLIAQGGQDVVKDVLQLRPHQFGGQGQRETPVATYEFFLRIAQVSQIKEWERLRQWMVDAAVEKVEAAVEAAFDADLDGKPLLKWEKEYVQHQVELGLSKPEAMKALSERRQGKYDFKILMSLVNEILDQKPRYGEIVNQEYLNLLGKVASELQAILETESIRDAIPYVTYQHLRTAEISLSTVLRNNPRTRTHAELYNLIRKVFGFYKDILDEICRVAHIDPITGKPVTPEQQQAAAPIALPAHWYGEKGKK